MRVLDLFSGIGGFALGLERAGMETVAFCEIDPFCRQVLKKHWPDIPCHMDIRRLTKKDLPEIDLICGGFPCQDISVANTQGVGLEGKRSGLWKEYHRIIKEVKPRYVIIENVANLRNKGLNKVLKDVWSLGYDLEWHIIPAFSVGLPHQRERIWILAYSRQDSRGNSGTRRIKQDGKRGDGPKVWGSKAVEASGPGEAHGAMAYTDPERLEISGTYQANEGEGSEGRAHRTGSGGNDGRFIKPESFAKYRTSRGEIKWSVEPELGRVVNGIPQRVDRIKSLGNAIVPHIAQLIGEAIIKKDPNIGEQSSVRA